MKKTISFVLALVMVLSLIMVPGVLSVSAEEAGPVVLKFHYSREDGAYDEWDLYSWGAITGAAPFVEEDGEMVATIYANANTASVGFIVRQGGDSWKGKDPDGDRFVESVYADLAQVQSGTLHIYLTSGAADFTVEEGADIQYSILMPGTVVKAGAKVSYAIVAENAVIEEGAVVGSAPTGDSGWGIAVVAGGVTIGANATVAPSAMIREDVKGGEQA